VQSSQKSNPHLLSRAKAVAKGELPARLASWQPVARALLGRAPPWPAHKQRAPSNPFAPVVRCLQPLRTYERNAPS
jgi:hypothetical protein